MSIIRRRVALVLPALAGFVAAFAGWLYAEGPAWTSDEFDICTNLGFTRDGRSLLSVHPAPDAGGDLRVRVVRRDAANGRLRAEIAVPANGAEQLVAAAIDADTVALAFDGAAESVHRLVLIDAATGRVAATAFDGGLPASVSPDRRWLAVRSLSGDGYDLFSVADAARALRLRRADAAVVSAAFAPDGRRLALLHFPFDESRRDWIDLVELPTGRLLRRFDLPPTKARVASVHWPDAGRVFLWAGSDWTSFGVDGDEPRVPWPEPHLNDSPRRTTIALQPDWFARCEHGELEPWQAWANRWTGRLGVPLFRQRGDANRVRVIDRQTRRGRAAWPVAGHTLTLSADGRRFACIAGDGRLYVCGSDGLPPAAWAAAFGVPAALLVGRLTRRPPTR